MRTPTALRRKGAGRAILAHIIEVARSRSYERLSLETGAMEAFMPPETLREFRLRILRAVRRVRGRSEQRLHDNAALGREMENSMITTAFELPGYRITKTLGVVRGIMVRSRSIVGGFVGGIQSIFGGNITIYTDLCERTRAETFQLMRQHAQSLHATAIVGMRYDATEIMPGLTEVLCYGTAS